MTKIVINFYNKSLLIIKIMPNKVTIHQLLVSLLIQLFIHECNYTYAINSP